MDILISVAAKVCEYTVAPVGRQLGYLFFYKQNVEDLRTKIVDLGHVKERLQLEFEAAQNDAKGIHADVKHWLAKADEVITEDHGNFTRDEEQANTKCICGAKFPNLVLRHRLSRRAKKMAETVATQIQEGEKTLKKGVSYRPQLPSSVGNKGYEDFESRNRTLTNVMEALRDPTVRMVGVWGMGGVGKTMLAKEVARRATDEEKLFTEFVFTAISKEQNIKDIQQDIGEKLRMRFDGETKDARADQLRNRLAQENNKILIIVDDIWGKLDLEAVGISFGKDKKGCKILLTTRSYHVLTNDMDVDSNFIFNVGDLSKHEAMSLFRKIAGDQAEKQELQGLASEIVEECGGLPIAITTVASALKNKKWAVWKSALHGLRNSNPGNIPNMEKEVYNSIQFSIDCLESVEAKHLLLLCSLFPEDAKIETRVLCDYGIGLNLFKGVNTLESARNNTEALVTILKDHSLLLDADSSYHGYECVKLHDVIRDVVISIASNYTLDDHHHRMHNIKNADELENYFNKEMFKDSTAISLYRIKADLYPQTLKGPNLNLLRLESTHYGENFEELPRQFFEGLDMLLVLDCERTSLGNIAFSLLPNLQTLRLPWCSLGDISWIGELKSLKILDLSFNLSIRELPRGIGKLTRLLSLNLERCWNLKVIESSVISSLTRLEELNLENSFTNWEEVEGVANAGDGRRNANLNELKGLTRLIDLKLEVRDINRLPKDIFSKKLEKYYINIGSYKGDKEYGKNNTSRTLKLRLCPNSALNEHDFAALLGRSETLYLSGLKFAKSVAFEIDRMGFQLLKHLTVEESIEIRCIVNSNNGKMDCPPAAFPSLESLALRELKKLENIIHEKLTAMTSFGKLRDIEVSYCDKLKSLFSLFNFPRQLESIAVGECKMMEEIISHDGREGGHVETIEISQLRELYLLRLPKLVQFIATSKSDEIKREGPQSIDAPLFNGQVICVLFPKLESLELCCLPNLERFCGGNISLPELKSLALDGHSNLKSFCEGKISLHKLESLKLNGLPNLERFCGGGISLPELKSLELHDLPNLERFCGGDCVDCPSLSTLSIKDCQKLKVFKTNIMPTTATEKEEENSTGSVAHKQHLSHHKDVASTSRPHPLGSVEEHDEYLVFKTERLSELYLWNFPNHQHQLPKTFSTLEGLSICEWDIRLKDLATPLMSLQNLKDLVVKDCHGLTSLFPPSTAKSLSQRLTHLTISGCKSLRQVIANDDEDDNINIIFSQLECLVLYDLSNLTSFYWGNNNVVLQFPCLDELRVGRCPEMKTFCHGNIHCPYLYHVAVVKWVTDERPEMRNFMWNFKMPSYTSGALCWKDDINTTIQKLWEDKNIMDSPQTEERIELVFPELYYLHIQDTQRNDQVPSSRFGFQSSTQIQVDKCDHLKGLMPSCMTASLVHLRKLYVSRCEDMKEIVFIEESAQVMRIHVSFPRLESLQLHNLPNLKWFFEGDISFPRLESLELRELPNLERFCGGDISLPKLESLKLDDLPNLKWFFEGDISFPRLESLELSELPNLERFCEGEISSPRLKSLKLEELPNLKGFCGGDYVDCPSLSKLSIKGCQKLKLFITNTMPMTTTQKEDKNSTGLVADKQHISHHKDVVKVDQLSTESSCSEITCQPHPLVSVEEHDEYLVFKTNCLSELKLWNFPNQQQLPKTFSTVELLSIAEWGIRLKNLATPLTSFQNLKVLVIKDCHGLTSLFSPSTAKSLCQRLTNLGISGCKSLRQVIANDDDVDDNINIIFSQLECVVLDDLSNLTSFYSGNNNVVLQFPHLAKLFVDCCPEMKTFCHGNIHCPSLDCITLPYTGQQIGNDMWYYDKMYIYGHPYWRGDINTTIQKLWEDTTMKKLLSAPIEIFAGN